MTRIALLAALLAATCQPAPSPSPSPAPAPAPSEQPAPIPTVIGPAPVRDCTTACANLEALHCPDAEPTPGGATCEEVCRNVVASGTVAYPVDCVTVAQSCRAAEACFK